MSRRLAHQLANEDNDDSYGAKVANQVMDGHTYTLAEGAAVGQFVKDIRSLHLPTNEEHYQQAADGHEVKGGDVVEEVKDGLSVNVQRTSRTEADGGEDADDSGAEGPYDGGFGTREFELFCHRCHDNFEERDGGGKCRNDEEKEEDEAEKVSACHLLEHHGKGGEGQRGSSLGLYAEGEGGRENNNACEDSHKAVGKHHADSTGGHVVLAAYVRPI